MDKGVKFLGILAGKVLNIIQKSKDELFYGKASIFSAWAKAEACRRVLATLRRDCRDF